jgi:hypothetical protein
MAFLLRVWSVVNVLMTPRRNYAYASICSSYGPDTDIHLIVIVVEMYFYCDIWLQYWYFSLYNWFWLLLYSLEAILKYFGILMLVFQKSMFTLVECFNWWILQFGYYKKIFQINFSFAAITYFCLLLFGWWKKHYSY